MTGPPVSNLRLFAPLPEPRESASALLEFPAQILRQSPQPFQLSDLDRRELQSLRAEGDPELLLESLLGLGRRWESRGRDQEALGLYAALLERVPEGAVGFDRLQRRAATLQGRGQMGDQVEHATRNFFHQATDPAMIFSFLVAGSVASAVRGFALGSLALRTESLLSRGWRARVLAGSLAFGAEVPAFVGATRLAQGTLGYERGFGELNTLPQELGGAVLFLGALKIGGSAASSLPAPSALRPLMRGGGTLGGIYLGHRLEEGFGWRSSPDEVHRWFAAGETYLQLRIGGRIAAGLLGNGAGWTRDLSQRVQRWEAESLRPSLPPTFDPSLLRPLRSAASIGWEEEVTEPVSRRELDAEILKNQLSESLGSRATSLVVQSIQGIAKQIKSSEPLLRLVQASQYRDAEGFETALRRMNYAANYAFPRGLTGSYLNWVVRAGMESAVRRQDQAHFDRLLQNLAEGASVEQLEVLASELDPHLRLFSENLFVRNTRLAQLMTLRGESHRIIRSLPLSKEAKQVLLAFDRRVKESDRTQVARTARDWLAKYPEHQGLIQDALVRARLSPAGAMRTQRLVNVLMYEPTHLAKLRELADMDLGVRSRQQFHPFHEVEMILGTQDDGYVGEPELARELSLLYRRLPDLLDAEKAEQRRERTQRILEQVWPDNGVPVDAESMRRALSLLGDPVSDSIERNLAADRFRLNVLPRREFMALFDVVGEEFPRRNFGGLFKPAAEDPSGQDSIYLMAVEAASYSAYRDLALLRLSSLVHEHTHFVRAPFQSKRGLRGTYLEEMLAEAQSFRWQAEQGDNRLLNQYLTIHPAGLGLFFRDWVNHTYFVLEDRD